MEKDRQEGCGVVVLLLLKERCLYQRKLSLAIFLVEGVNILDKHIFHYSKRFNYLTSILS